MSSHRRPDESFWESLWKREEEFRLSGKPEFRHDTAFVAVSAIAGQFYCEYKVENEFTFGQKKRSGVCKTMTWCQVG